MTETEDIVTAAENNILVAIRLLLHVCGPDRAPEVAHQLVDDHFRFERARSTAMPFLPGLH